MVSITLDLLFELSLTLQGYYIVLHRNVEIITLHARQIDLEHQFILIFEDVDARHPGTSDDLLAAARRNANKKPRHLILQAAKLAKRIVFNHVHYHFLQKQISE